MPKLGFNLFAVTDRVLHFDAKRLAKSVPKSMQGRARGGVAQLVDTTVHRLGIGWRIGSQERPERGENGFLPTGRIAGLQSFEGAIDHVQRPLPLEGRFRRRVRSCGQSRQPSFRLDCVD